MSTTSRVVLLTLLWLVTWFFLNCAGVTHSASTSLQTGASSQVSTNPVPAAYFGMHVHAPTNSNPYSWPTVQFGAYRSWDNWEGTCWPYIQRSGPDSYDWTVLDNAVLKAQAEGKEFLYTLGPSPAQAWAVIDSKSYSAGACGSSTGPATSNEPDHTRWKQFITKLVSRYCGCTAESHPTARIRQYEIWNEPNLTGAEGHSTFFLPASGSSMDNSAQSMAKLARIAYTTIKSIDPGAVVVSPSATGNAGVDWLQRFVGADGGKYADVIGFHLYSDTPEQMSNLASTVRSTIDEYAPGKPLWNTEAGWTGRAFSNDDAAAFVARANLLSWSSGVQRFYWYAWDDQSWASLRLTTGPTTYPETGSYRDVTGVSPAGTAYSEVYDWMVGATVSCGEWQPQLWKCEVTRSGGYHGYVLWTTADVRSITLPTTWNVKQSRDLAGNTKMLAGNTSVQVGTEPQLFENTQ